MFAFVRMTNSRATTSKMSSCGFLPSNQLHVASPDDLSRTIMVVFRPPLLSWTMSPALNSGIGLPLCGYGEVYCSHYTPLLFFRPGIIVPTWLRGFSLKG